MAQARAFLKSQERGQGLNEAMRSAGNAGIRMHNAANNRRRLEEKTADSRKQLELMVQQALGETNGNKTQAARLLGLSRDKVQRLSGVMHM